MQVLEFVLWRRGRMILPPYSDPSPKNWSIEKLVFLA